MTEVLEATTTIHAPRDDVYAFLRDVEGYGEYSEYVRGITRHGDGGEGTEYDVTFAWWRLSYTARARVTELDPPERIAWGLTGDLDAHGSWRLDPADVDDPDVDCATRVALVVRYDPDSADDAVSLPSLVPMSTVVEKARPVVEREAERVLARVVADLEGRPRQASLAVRTGPESE